MKSPQFVLITNSNLKASQICSLHKTIDVYPVHCDFKDSAYITKRIWTTETFSLSRGHSVDLLAYFKDINLKSKNKNSRESQ